MGSLNLKIVTPDQIVLEKEVDAVYAFDSEGRFGILTGHIPMVSALEIGVLCYFIDTVQHCVAVMGGLLQTDGKNVVVLSDAAELGDQIDVLRAEHAKRRAEERLAAKERASMDVQRAELALARAMTRIRAAQGFYRQF